MSHISLSREAKLNLILFMVVLCLSLIAWYQPGLQKTMVHYLSNIKADNIHSIVIERQGIGTVKLSKQNNNWFIEQPYQLPANSLRVDTITALAEKRSYSQFQVKKSDLGRYQLDNPPLIITLNSQKFALGATDPIKKQRYAISVDNSSDNIMVHLINGVIYYQLRAALNTFISPSLVPPQAKITRIDWADKILTVNNGLWQLTPEDPEVSTDSMLQFVQYWQQTQASRVETEVSVNITNSEQVINKSNSKSIVIHYDLPGNKSEKLNYLIIQDDKQLKLVRTDMKIAYWLSAKQLQKITEFLPLINE